MKDNPKLVFATNNQHKLEEARMILGPDLEVLSLNYIGFRGDIPENEMTFAGNALVKARTVYDFCGLPCFADDSGLCVKALGGAPGVRSARYAGDPPDDSRNVTKLLAELDGQQDRSASFVTVIAYISNGLEYIFDGSVPGAITLERQGFHGFGYDPVFLPEGHELTFAEMPASRKNLISHRAAALKKFCEFLAAH